ncbi:DUF6415 family natural product biosynthesis protein [Streptomyces griseoruber]|uniref:DUF6415 family natural product biosynthesis protein n=1 Tax=Streptomyces griseoruber TaxID=1943 RepID=UPI0006E44968|nr:DUF6415 family natural product biosynthesis protein [Streptomyces griseoruber]
MAEAASSATATAHTPAPPSGADKPSTSTTDTIDADAIRRTYDAVLWAPDSVPIERREWVGGMLRGHVQLLVPELTEAVPGLSGAWRSTAEHVLATTDRMLAADVGTSPDDLHRLATHCRALLSLRRQAGPLTCLTAPVTEVRA